METRTPPLVTCLRTSTLKVAKPGTFQFWPVQFSGEAQSNDRTLRRCNYKRVKVTSNRANFAAPFSELAMRLSETIKNLRRRPLRSRSRMKDYTLRLGHSASLIGISLTSRQCLESVSSAPTCAANETKYRLSPPFHFESQPTKLKTAVLLLKFPAIWSHATT